MKSALPVPSRQLGEANGATPAHQHHKIALFSVTVKGGICKRNRLRVFRRQVLLKDFPPAMHPPATMVPHPGIVLPIARSDQHPQAMDRKSFCGTKWGSRLGGGN